MVKRRQVLQGIAATLVVTGARPVQASFRADLEAREAESGGRIGAAICDGAYLSAAGRRQLQTRMLATRTGLPRLRAGLNPEWKVGNKTGTATAAIVPNRTNDVACVWLGDGRWFTHLPSSAACR